MTTQFRGLTNFITEIRACANKEEEDRRIEKELANIRKKFTSGRLSEYDRRKYVWKMVFMSMMGYDIDFGMDEVLNLAGMPNFSDKLIGYMAATVMLTKDSPEMGPLRRILLSDLQSENREIQCLALDAVGNIGGKDLANDVGDEVLRLLMARSTSVAARKKCALVLLRLFRASPTVIDIGRDAPKLIRLLEMRDFGSRQAVLGLIEGVTARSVHGFEAAVPKLASLLLEGTRDKLCPQGYTYHHVAAPWYLVRVLRILRRFPWPADDAVAAELTSSINHILKNTRVTKSHNHNNASHSILFEAINLVIRHGTQTERLVETAAEQLARFVNIKEPNIRYLGLEAMTRLAALPGTKTIVKQQQRAVFISLREADISLRRRALDLLFVMGDRENAQQIVEQLLEHLTTAEKSIKDEMTLKIAILAERYAPDLRWYVDTVLRLIDLAGDFVSDDIWHRVVQIVTNNESLQRYAAEVMFKTLESELAHEAAVKCGSYLIGEFGYKLNTNEGEAADAFVASGRQQYDVLAQHFERSSAGCRSILLSAFAKMSNLYPDLREELAEVFAEHATSVDADLQQRAVEFLHLGDVSAELVEEVLDAMPAFAERESKLEARLAKGKAAGKDVDAWEEAADGAGDDDRGAEVAAADQADEDEGAEAAAAAGGGVEEEPDEDEEQGGFDEDDGAADLLGLSAPAAPVAEARRVTIERDDRAALREGFARAVGQLSAELFRNDLVAISVRMQFKGALGRVFVAVENLSAQPLTQLVVDVPQQTGLAMKAGPTPAEVAAGATGTVELRMRCMAAFASAIPLHVSATGDAGATEHSYKLHLPVTAMHFVDALTMDVAAFDGRWGALQGDGRDTSVTVRQCPSVAEAERRLSGLKLGFTGGKAAFSLRTEAVNAKGKKVSVGCLALLQPAEGGEGVTVSIRTQHKDATRAGAMVCGMLLKA